MCKNIIINCADAGKGFSLHWCMNFQKIFCCVNSCNMQYILKELGTLSGTKQGTGIYLTNSFVTQKCCRLQHLLSTCCRKMIAGKSTVKNILRIFDCSMPEKIKSNHIL